MAKEFTPKVVTANALIEGDVVYFTAQDSWTRHLAQADPRASRRDDVDSANLDTVAARLADMDRRSRRGPWTADVLELIARRPGVVARELAAELGRETRAFKADVRRLKELGLTESLEVGYRLSSRGKQLIKAARKD